MSDANEQMEVAEHAKHAAQDNKHIALLIAILALFLALSEMLGKSANTEALTFNINAADTWSFFQAKSIRRTLLLVAADAMKAESDRSAGDAKSALDKQITTWRETAARYESEPKPEGGEGTRELFKRAKDAERERDIELARYHNYEFASAAFQIGIVLCSAAIITGMLVLAWAAGGVAIVGLVFITFGLFAPHLLHLG
jgi:uncharacterized Tic20 family protein